MERLWALASQVLRLPGRQAGFSPSHAIVIFTPSDKGHPALGKGEPSADPGAAPPSGFLVARRLCREVPRPANGNT